MNRRHHVQNEANADSFPTGFPVASTLVFLFSFSRIDVIVASSTGLDESRLKIP